LGSKALVLEEAEVFCQMETFLIDINMTSHPNCKAQLLASSEALTWGLRDLDPQMAWTSHAHVGKRPLDHFSLFFL
jgi:hypothetical protein